MSCNNNYYNNGPWEYSGCQKFIEDQPCGTCQINNNNNNNTDCKIVSVIIPIELYGDQIPSTDWNGCFSITILPYNLRVPYIYSSYIISPITPQRIKGKSTFFTLGEHTVSSYECNTDDVISLDFDISNLTLANIKFTSTTFNLSLTVDNHIIIKILPLDTPIVDSNDCYTINEVKLEIKYSYTWVCNNYTINIDAIHFIPIIIY